MPKLADAWVDISTRDAGFTKGLKGAQKQVEATSASFSRSGAILTRSVERPYRAMRRIFNMLEEVSKETQFGKNSVEDYDHAWKALLDSLIMAVTGGTDVALIFETLADVMRMLTKGTVDYQFAVDGVTLSLVQARKYWGKLFGDTADEQQKLAVQIDELNEKIRSSNNDLTKRDVTNAQKRADAAKKEAREKSASFLSIEESWKDAQKRLFDRGGMGGEPAAPAGAGGGGLAIPAGRRGPDINTNEPDRHLPTARSDLESHGIIAEFVDKLSQSNDPADRKYALKLQEQQNAYLKVIADEAKKKKGGFGP